jgi:dCTP deaminase
VILTDREIKIAIERRIITIEPRPEERAFSSTSVDLTLDPIISEFKQQITGIEQVLDPACGGANHEEIMAALTQQRTISEDGYLLQPRKLVLGWTREYVDLKYDARIAARVEGKSSLVWGWLFM